MASNRRILLRARPEGRIEPSIFDHVEEDVPTPGDGDALVRTEWISLDPTNRIWISEHDAYLPPVPLGEVVRAVGVGRVEQSNDDAMPEGAYVVGMTGWQDYLLASQAEAPLTVLPDDLPVDPRHALGVLGHTGLTAYFGLEDIGRPQEGETVVISAAAGATGSVAGQIVKARGARAVGLAGSEEKCRLLVDDLGFDAAINYKDDDWRDQLDAACPDGIDVDFENVGGEILEHVLRRMNTFGRVIACGLISQYNAEGEDWAALRNFEYVLMRRLRVNGFLILDLDHRFEEGRAYLGGLMQGGKLKPLETIDERDLPDLPAILNRLYDGDNVGKLLVRVDGGETP